MALQGDAKFLPELFQRLKSSEARDKEWLDQVAFLQELCSLGKHLQAASRSQLLGKLINLGLFEVRRLSLRTATQEPCHTVRSRLSTELSSSASSSSLNILRSKCAFLLAAGVLLCFEGCSPPRPCIKVSCMPQEIPSRMRQLTLRLCLSCEEDIFSPGVARAA